MTATTEKKRQRRKLKEDKPKDKPKDTRWRGIRHGWRKGKTGQSTIAKYPLTPNKELPIIQDVIKFKGRGRPSKLTQARLAQIEMICKLTVNPSYYAIARTVGVTEATFHQWLHSFKGLRELIDKWCAHPLMKLRKKAYKMAMNGDSSTLRFLLERRDDDFRDQRRVELDIKPVFDESVPPPTFV